MFCVNGNFKFWPEFKCLSTLIVHLPVLATTPTKNVVSHLISIKTLNIGNTFKPKFKVHLNIEVTEVSSVMYVDGFKYSRFK